MGILEKRENRQARGSDICERCTCLVPLECGGHHVHTQVHIYTHVTHKHTYAHMYSTLLFRWTETIL